MDTLAHAITAPAAVYSIAGRRVEMGTAEFAEAVAEAHAAHQRPRCLCQVDGVEMYVARLAGPNGGYIVKRMPDTGSHHAPDCPSYEPPAECSGLGQVLGSAISEDPATGETTLKLDFALTRLPGRPHMAPTGASERDSVSSDGTRLSLRGLLHYLWDQAELNRWHPGFAGKRSWATVRRKILQAALHKSACGRSLYSRLYVPEPFSIEERDAINARRLAQWQTAGPAPGKAQPLMLLIGEVKEIVKARYGFKAIVKHLPDQAFTLDEQLYRRLGRRFEAELALWGASDDIHLVMIATFGLSNAGVPAIHELCLMPVTRQWLPVEDGFEKQLVEKLVGDGRSFIKGLRYGLGATSAVACATLTDGGASAPLLFVSSADIADHWPPHQLRDPSTPLWRWNPSSEAMPPLPPRQDSRQGVVTSSIAPR